MTFEINKNLNFILRVVAAFRLRSI